MLAVESGNANLRAHRGLRHRQRDGAVQIVPFPLKKWMLLHMQHHVEIARRSSERSSLASTGKADAGAVFYARGNLRVHRALPQHTAFPSAFRARIGNHAARSLAGRTSPRDAEKALLVPHLPTASAGTAGCWTFARRGSRPTAIFAGFVTPHHHARLGAECSLFELDGYVFAQISAALHPAAAASAASEGIAEAEELAEDFAEILERRGVEACARTGGAAHAGMAEAVVERALLRVGQYGVGLGDFFEAFFRIRIVRIAVGMVLHGELAISALEFHLARRTAHRQYFVIIAFCVRGQNRHLS